MALATASLAMVAHANAETILRFKLLTLDGLSVKWGGDSNAQVTLNYAFVTTASRFTTARNCKEMAPVDELLAASAIPTKVFDEEVRAAFDMWERATPIRFEFSGDETTANILIGIQKQPEGRAFTDVSYRRETSTTGRIDRSLICLNPAQSWKVGFDGNKSVYDLRYTLAHEIGHAIGLDHPSASGQLMSFRYDERFSDLQAGDIAGAAALYNFRRLATP